MGLHRAFDVDGRTIDDQCALGDGGQYLGPYRKHMLAGRQHRNHDVGALDRANRAVGDPGTVGLRLIARGFHQIEARHLLAGLDQIGGHRPAHVAEPDECDVGHV